MDRRGAPSARRLIYDQSPEHNNLTIEGPGGNGGCCFDYGNAETNSRDSGNGHMDAINFSTECWFARVRDRVPGFRQNLRTGCLPGPMARTRITTATRARSSPPNAARIGEEKGKKGVKG